MKEMMPWMFALLALSTICWMIIQQAFFSRLSKIHPEVWEDLGRPALFFNSNMANGSAFLKYLWRRDYESLPDMQTVSLGRFLRWHLILHMIYFAVVLIAILSIVRLHK